MKRRNFIKDGALLLGAPLAVGTAGRLYGTPASIQPRDISDLDKFKLPLANFGVPVELWDNFSRVSKLWDDVLTNESEAALFNADPKAYFTALGLDSSDKTFTDESVILLRTMATSQAREALAKSDYASLYATLSESGAFERRDPSALQATIEKVFSENLAEIQKSFSTSQHSLDSAQQTALLASLSEAGVHATSDDLVALTQLIGPGNQQSPMCASCVAAVVIAVIAALYVSVTIAVTVGLLVGAWISAAVQVAIAVEGNCGLKPCVQPVDTHSSPFSGGYAKLDPVLMRNAERANRLALVTNNPGLRLHTAREVIAAEVTSVLSAMKSTSLLDVELTAMPTVIEAVTKFSWKALGISPSAQAA